MESKGVSEILAGTIRGQGGKSTCMVSALKLTRRGSKDVIYTDYRIRDVAGLAASPDIYSWTRIRTIFLLPQAKRQVWTA